MSKLLPALLLGLSFSTTACAAPATTDVAEAVTAGVHSLAPQTKIDSIEPSPVKGIQEVSTGGQVVYFSDDGKYLIAGDIIEVSTAENLTEQVRARARAQLLKNSDSDTHLVYGEKNNPKTVYVFTDPSCPYCQHFHKEVAAIVEAGITVEYLAWPRGGPRGDGYGQTQAVWCSSDKESAYDKVMNGQRLAVASCEHPIRTHYELGESLEVHGTPAIFDSTGKQLGGYVPADVVIKSFQG